MAWLFRDPPKNWWPADVDPVKWADSKNGAASLKKNPPAVRQYTPMEAIKTGMLPLMWLSLGISAGVSLFGISYMVPFAKDLGFGPLIAASSAGVLSIINGTGTHGDRLAIGPIRAQADPAGRPADRGALTGRTALRGQGRERGRVPGLRLPGRLRWRCVLPDVRLADPDYFGENNNASNYGLVYSSKLVGSIVGIGVGASVIDAWGYTGAYWIAAVSALVSAGIATFLRQPGRSRVPTTEPGTPVSKRSLTPTLAD